jgi:hypothetical protein
VVEHRERATDVLSEDIESAGGPYENLGIVGGRLDRPPNEIERFAPIGLGIPVATVVKRLLQDALAAEVEMPGPRGNDPVPIFTRIDTGALDGGC